MAQDLLRVRRSCSPGAADEGLGANETATPQFESASLTFGFGAHFVIAQPAEYKVCWCRQSSGVAACSRSDDFSVDAGILRLEGSNGGQERSCFQGYACSLVDLAGLRLLAGDLLTVLQRCGTGSSIPGLPGANGDEFVVASTGNGRDFYFAEGEALRSAAGIFRLCWCRPDLLHPCTSASDFQAPAGLFTSQGPYAGQSFACFLGSSCNFTLQGVGLHHADKLWALETCGQSSLASWRLGPLSAAFDAVPELSLASRLSFNLGLLPLEDGVPERVRLCWCPSAKSCAGPEGFRAEGAVLHVLCPAGQFALKLEQAAADAAPAACQPCRRGTVCRGGEELPEACPQGATTLMSGAKSQDECHCKPGYKAERDGSCSACPAGRFKGNISDATTCHGVCPGNSTSTAGALGLIDCFCPPGTYDHDPSETGIDCRKRVGLQGSAGSQEAKVYQVSSSLRLDMSQNASNAQVLAAVRKAMAEQFGLPQDSITLTLFGDGSARSRRLRATGFFLNFSISLSDETASLEMADRLKPEVLALEFQSLDLGSPLYAAQPLAGPARQEIIIECSDGLAFSAQVRPTSVRDCQCTVGREFGEGGCSPCEVGKFKETIGNVSCKVCPFAQAGEPRLTTFGNGSSAGLACTCPPKWVVPHTFAGPADASDLDIPCQLCGDGLECPGGTQRLAKSGWWLTQHPSDGPKVVPCPLSNESCDKNNSCHAGYEGVACAICSEGRARSGAKCDDCGEMKLGTAGFVIPLVLVFLVATALPAMLRRNDLRRKRAPEPTDSTTLSDDSEDEGLAEVAEGEHFQVDVAALGKGLQVKHFKACLSPVQELVKMANTAISAKLRIILLSAQALSSWLAHFANRFPDLLLDEYFQQFWLNLEGLRRWCSVLAMDLAALLPGQPRCAVGSLGEFTLYFWAVPGVLLVLFLSSLVISGLVLRPGWRIALLEVKLLLIPLFFWITYLSYSFMATLVFSHLPLPGSSFDCTLRYETGCRLRLDYGVALDDASYWGSAGPTSIAGAILWLPGVPLVYFLFLYRCKDHINISRHEGEPALKWATRRNLLIGQNLLLRIIGKRSCSVKVLMPAVFDTTSQSKNRRHEPAEEALPNTVPGSTVRAETPWSQRFSKSSQESMASLGSMSAITTADVADCEVGTVQPRAPLADNDDPHEEMEPKEEEPDQEEDRGQQVKAAKTLEAAALETLFQHFLPDRWWFEVVNILRQLLLTGVMTIFNFGAAVHLYLSVVVMLVYLMLLVYLNPYVNPSDQAMQVLCTTSLVLVFVSALVVQAFQGVEHLDPEQRKLEAGMLGLVSATVFTVAPFLLISSVGWQVRALLLLKVLVKKALKEDFEKCGLRWCEIEPLLTVLADPEEARKVLRNPHRLMLLVAESFPSRLQQLALTALDCDFVRSRLEPQMKDWGLTYDQFKEALARLKPEDLLALLEEAEESPAEALRKASELVPEAAKPLVAKGAELALTKRKQRAVEKVMRHCGVNSWGLEESKQAIKYLFMEELTEMLKHTKTFSAHLAVGTARHKILCVLEEKWSSIEESLAANSVEWERIKSRIEGLTVAGCLPGKTKAPELLSHALLTFRQQLASLALEVLTPIFKDSARDWGIKWELVVNKVQAAAAAYHCTFLKDTQADLEDFMLTVLMAVCSAVFTRRFEAVGLELPQGDTLLTLETVTSVASAKEPDKLLAAAKAILDVLEQTMPNNRERLDRVRSSLTVPWRL